MKEFAKYVVQQNVVVGIHRYRYLPREKFTSSLPSSGLVTVSVDNLEIIFELVSSKYIQYTDFFQIQILQAIARIISWIVEDLLFSNLQILRLAISALISISPNYAVSRKRERLAPINQFKQMHIPQVLANYLIIVLIRVLFG